MIVFCSHWGFARIQKFPGKSRYLGASACRAHKMLCDPLTVRDDSTKLCAAVVAHPRSQSFAVGVASRGWFSGVRSDSGAVLRGLCTNGVFCGGGLGVSGDGQRPRSGLEEDPIRPRSRMDDRDWPARLSGFQFIFGVLQKTRCGLGKARWALGREEVYVCS